jgi:hypothetical protein
MPMTGSLPIETYYPNGFGILFGGASACSFVWMPDDIEINRFNEIYEMQRLCECGSLAVRANYRVRTSANQPDQDPDQDQDTFFCSYDPIGPIKYAVVAGEFPPSLYLNIDTGNICGIVDNLMDIAPERFGGIDFKFNETNYLQGAKPGGEIYYTIRAFDSGNTAAYSDKNFTLYVQTNWSSRRDKFILNIENQFYLNGYPVTNREYINGMKDKGFYPGPGCE